MVNRVTLVGRLTADPELRTTPSGTQVASLRPHQELRWHRISPTAEQPDGPVLYQLLFSASGTPGTVPAFDTNMRHLTNSPITVNGGIEPIVV